MLLISMIHRRYEVSPFASEFSNTALAAPPPTHTYLMIYAENLEQAYIFSIDIQAKNRQAFV